MTDTTFDAWGIVELMGRKVVAGRIMRGEPFPALIRVDVPETKKFAAYTQFYGESAIYCVTLTSEEVARRTAESMSVDPVTVYVPALVTIDELEKWKEEAKHHRNLPVPEDEAPF